VIRVPEGLLSADAPSPEAGAQDSATPEEAPQRLAPVPVVGPTHVVGTTSGGLPKRRRRSGPVTVVPALDSAGPQEPAEADSEVTASRIGAFARGTQLGRTTNTTEGPDNQ
jgi:hypothetical protein